MESEKQHNELVMTQAAQWYARLRAPDCTDSDRERFRQWLSDSANAKAYADAESMAERITNKVFADPRLRDMAADALKPTSLGFRKQTAWRWAAVVVLGVAFGIFSASGFWRGESSAPSVAKFANTLLQQQRIRLEDGSVVHLDIDSALSVQMSEAERRVELLKGRAYFEVTRDSSRPFSVSAGGARTVALGTRFQIALAGKSVSVTLAEGSVAVADTTSQENWREVLQPGEQLTFVAETGVREKSTVDAAIVTSWSRGRLVFKGTPLAEALEEVNRYAETKIHLGDPMLASTPIGGNFIAGGNSEEFVEALSAVIPLRSVRVGADEIVLFQRYEKDIL